jgi:hypothetical protein
VFYIGSTLDWATSYAQPREESFATRIIFVSWTESAGRVEEIASELGSCLLPIGNAY